MQRVLARLQPALDIPYILRTRRNHGLEHATIHVMAGKVARLRIAGRSDDRGFYLFGNVSTDMVEECVTGALARMQAGEHHLAVHPNCGTNLVTTASMVAGASLVALMGSEREQGGKLGRLPLMILGIMLALIFSEPLGMQFQASVTTLGNPGDLRILSISRKQRGKLVIHRVRTYST